MPEKSSLAGRHAVVTGAGRGIGRVIALALTRAGADVTAIGRSAQPLDELVGAGGAARALSADVTDADALTLAFARAVDAAGPVDLLVANAGGAETAPFLKTPDAMFERMFALNVMGTVHAVRAVLPGMIERRSGRIIMIASTAGLKPYAYVSAYVTAKHAVIGLMRALALETAETGVSVNAICPGFTDTDLVEESIARIVAKTGRTREEALGELVKNNPQKRLIAPDEVAATVLWLASEGARSVTGQAISIAGGEVMG